MTVQDYLEQLQAETDSAEARGIIQHIRNNLPPHTSWLRVDPNIRLNSNVTYDLVLQGFVEGEGVKQRLVRNCTVQWVLNRPVYTDEYGDAVERTGFYVTHASQVLGAHEPLPNDYPHSQP